MAAAPAATPPGEVAIRAALDGADPREPGLWDTGRWRDRLLGLYRTRAFAPLWLEGHTLTRAASGLLAQMRAAEALGLSPADYGGEPLQSRAGSLAGAAGDARELARLDLAITAAAARFITDLHSGRVNPRDAGNDLDVPHASIDLAAALAALASTSDVPGVLADYEPPFRHYDLLKRSLAQYRSLAAQPGLNALPALPHRSVKPGEPYAGAAALGRLLAALGDLPASSADSLPGRAGTLDGALSAGLGKFQARHGLRADGALGATTWQALTVPLARRVRQIELSLERLRWLPPKLATPPIIVNIPEFRLFAFYRVEDDESAMLAMDVIVGKTFKPTHTPVFAADMKYVVFRPFWDVPRSIAAQEVLPKLRANPGWAARNGFEIVRGQGDDARPVPVNADSIEALARGELRVRQRPGADNALGLVKLMLPNPHNVYLHSTPAQSLFSQATRAFSHGCVRVEDPVALVQYALREDPAWTRERILEAMQNGPPAGAPPLRVYLKRPIRVFMLYATAIGSEDGRTLFFRDIYGHDARLEALLRARSQRALASSSLSSRQAPRGRNGEPE